jgi:hypothetical protein
LTRIRVGFFQSFAPRHPEVLKKCDGRGRDERHPSQNRHIAAERTEFYCKHQTVLAVQASDPLHSEHTAALKGLAAGR